MKIYTIPKKQSGTGSIHDLASQHHDREIRFSGKQRYAVALAAFYVENSSAPGYTTHETEASTMRQARKMNNYSLQIIDADGNHYTINGNELVKMN